MSVAGTLYEETVKFGHAKLLSTQTATGVTFLTFTSFSSEFSSYHFDIINLRHNDGTYPFFVAQLSSTGGASWSNSYWYGFYYNCSHSNTYGSIGAVSSGTLQDAIWCGGQCYPGYPTTGEVIIHCAPSKSCQFQSHISCNHPTLGNEQFITGSGQDTIGINGVRFFFYNGTSILGGTVRMYGLRSGLI